MARRAVVWNDLIRDGAGVAGARVMSLAGPAPVRHDAVLSVRRGFTLDEAESFAEADAMPRFVETFVRAWTKVMEADRFDHA